MQRVIQLSAVLSIMFAVTQEAKAFGVGADLGYSRVLVQDSDDKSGYGGDLYIRPLPLPIIDPELQLGFHRFSMDTAAADANFTIYPLLAGARLYIPVVPIFVGAHAGVVGSRISAKAAGNGPTFSDTNWDFGFNIAAGYHFLDLTLIKLGLILNYYVVPANHGSSAPDFNMFTAGLDIALGF
jgi:hypothetical protein